MNFFFRYLKFFKLIECAWLYMWGAVWIFVYFLQSRNHYVHKVFLDHLWYSWFFIFFTIYDIFGFFIFYFLFLAFITFSKDSDESHEMYLSPLFYTMFMVFFKFIWQLFAKIVFTYFIIYFRNSSVICFLSYEIFFLFIRNIFFSFFIVNC